MCVCGQADFHFCLVPDRTELLLVNAIERPGLFGPSCDGQNRTGGQGHRPASPGLGNPECYSILMDVIPSEADRFAQTRARINEEDTETMIEFGMALDGRIVVAVDPPAGMGEGSCCGIIVAGLDRTGRGVVMADCSVEGASPAGWANAVVRAFRRFDADRIVAEVNQGGDMVSAVLRGIDAQLPVMSVRASCGKWLRAEPVAALYEQGRVVHAGSFPALEDQMCDFGPDGLSSGRSPDRLDALVWALTALMLDGGGEPRVRGI